VESANELVLRFQEQTRRAEAAGARADAAEKRAVAAEVKVLEVQHAARTQQQRAELAEERVKELERGAEVSVPVLMRAAEGVGAVVAGMELRELLALDETWAAAAETIRTARAERARQMPERFLCPISQALTPLPYLPPFPPIRSHSAV
jgi:malonyl CoA-acyl carrier protein transacylase